MQSFAISELFRLSNLAIKEHLIKRWHLTRAQFRGNNLSYDKSARRREVCPIGVCLAGRDAGG